MLARRQSKCPVCFEMIEPGHAIQHEDRVGWVHVKCAIGLDDPLPRSAPRDYPHDRFPAFKTQRDHIDYFQQLDESEDVDLYYDPIFGGYAGHDIGDWL